MEYRFKTEPFPHQREVFDTSRDLESFAVLWEQGTGKTKLAIDTFAYLYQRGEVDAMLVVAPKGVHRNWVAEEIPAHMPDGPRGRARMHCWSSAKATTKTHRNSLRATIEWSRGPAVLAVNYEAFITDRGKRAVWDFLKKRRVFYVLDEAHHIKTPGAKTTKSVVASGKYARYRRVLTGTPVSQGPFDLYSPFRFLDEGFWARRGMRSFYAFKQHYGIWETMQVRQNGSLHNFERLVSYKNLDELSRVVDTHSSRVTKDVLDLPPQLFSKRPVEMSREQARVYEALARDFQAELDGATVTAALPIVRLLRLQQVLCGYFPEDDPDPDGDGRGLVEIPGPNPRVEALRDLLDECADKTIIWARFRPDVDRIMEVVGDRGVRYDGAMSDDGRAAALDAFRKGDAQFFVGNPAAAGEGLTLHVAKTVVYYSNSFKLIHRLQSQDRAHRAGMDDRPVLYVDLLCPGTIDTRIVSNLRAKRDIAAALTGDRLRDWL